MLDTLGVHLIKVKNLFGRNVYMRRANGSGNIYKMKGGRRRNPWRVRVTVGWELNQDQQM